VKFITRLYQEKRNEKLSCTEDCRAIHIANWLWTQGSYKTVDIWKGGFKSNIRRQFPKIHGAVMIGHVISMHRCSSGSMNLSCLQLRMRCRDKTFISLKILTLSIPYGCFRRFSVLSCWYFALQVTTGDSLVQVPWPTSTSLVLSVVFACSSAASYTSVSCTTAAVWTGYLGIIWWVFLYGQWNIGDWCCASWGVIQVSLRLFCGACDLSLRAFTRRLRAFTTCSATATFLWRYVSEFWKSNEFILCWLSDFGRNLL